jgi:hypothetical protein
MAKAKPTPPAERIDIGPLLEKILAGVPGEFQPIAEAYGRRLVHMGLDDLRAEIAAQITTPIANALAGLDDDQLLDAGATLVHQWDQTNADNAKRIAERAAIEYAATISLLNVLIGVAAARIPTP